ncbi:hypothetical protein L13192_12372 [Pyrenophora tritici-repentis]|nr:hypothetical protein L13192_12372 [Pyrenophora tritici-repentis]
MHPSTIAAILAFTAGMPAIAAPANRGLDGYGPLSHAAVVPTNPEQIAAFHKIMEYNAQYYAQKANGKRDPQLSSKMCAKAADRKKCEEPRPAAAIPYQELQLVNNKQQKRDDAQRVSIDNDCLTPLCASIMPTEPFRPFRGVQKQEEIQPSEKRDAQRSRGRVFGNIAEGIGGVIGAASDLVTIGGAVQGQQKREAQRSRGRVFGNIAEGIGGVIGAASDLITIGGAVQGQQKRDAQRFGMGGLGCIATNPSCLDQIRPFRGVQKQEEIQPSEKRDAQRSRGRVFGNIAEGIGGVIGAASDLVTIGGVVQGQQKREAQRISENTRSRCLSVPCEPEGAHASIPRIEMSEEQNKGKIVSNIFNRKGGDMTVKADTATIVGAAQGQSQPAQKREARESIGHCLGFPGCGRGSDIASGVPFGDLPSTFSPIRGQRN